MIDLQYLRRDAMRQRAFRLRSSALRANNLSMNMSLNNTGWWWAR
jgi:hypothetical protein